MYMKTPRQYLRTAYATVSVSTVKVAPGVYETAFVGLTTSDPIVSQGKDAAGRMHDDACDFARYPHLRDALRASHVRMARMLADAVCEVAA